MLSAAPSAASEWKRARLLSERERLLAAVVVGGIVVVIGGRDQVLIESWLLSSLEGFECRGKGPHDLAPSGHRSACVFAPHQRDAGADAKRSILGDFEAARFGAKLDLFRRAHRLGDNVVAGETEADQRGDRERPRRANGARRGRPKARSRARGRRSPGRASPDRAAPC